MGLFSWLFGKLTNSRDIPSNDKALLVGINAYDGAPLRGCVNDVMNMKEFLVSQGYFKPENICVLLNRDAKTSAILDKLSWLVDVTAGSKCFYHYSGHGAQVPNPEEEDGLSEVQCPQDFDWSPGRMITDKQFVNIFSKIPPGVKFNWLSDSCHSGDLDREIPLAVLKKGVPNCARRMLPPPHIASIIQKIKSKAHKVTRIREMVGGTINVGFISACRSDQTAADTEIDGQACGAFTAYFLKAANYFQKDITLADLVDQIRLALSTNGYDQVPQVDGPRATIPLLS
jgi:hypothetical protein